MRFGDRVRLTVHDAAGTPHTAEGSLAALAAGPGQALAPREPAPWACLVKLDPVDGISTVIPYNVIELEFLPEADEEGSSDSSKTVRDAYDKITALDDECADLTAKLAAASKEIANLNAALTKANDMLEVTRERHTELAGAPSKIAAATRPSKSR